MTKAKPAKQKSIILDANQVRHLLARKALQVMVPVKGELKIIHTNHTGIPPKTEVWFAGYKNVKSKPIYISVPFTPGSVVAVKERCLRAFKPTKTNNGFVYLADYGHRSDLVSYEQALSNWKWLPASKCPASAVRLHPVVASVRVGRCADITEEESHECGYHGFHNADHDIDAMQEFESNWEKLFPKHSFDSSWCWIVELEIK